MSAAAKVKPAKHVVYIGLGSNIEPENNLPRAVAALSQHVSVYCISTIWQAPALGTQGPDFLNAVIKVETGYSAEDLKNRVLRPIEASLGRERGADKNTPRTIDLDILIFDGLIDDPHIWDYAHLAVPLADCHPELVNPVTGQTISQVASELKKAINISRTPLNLSNLNK